MVTFDTLWADASKDIPQKTAEDKRAVIHMQIGFMLAVGALTAAVTDAVPRSTAPEGLVNLIGGMLSSINPARLQELIEQVS